MKSGKHGKSSITCSLLNMEVAKVDVKVVENTGPSEAMKRVDLGGRSDNR